MQELRRNVVNVDVTQSVCVLEKVDLDVSKLAKWASYTQKLVKRMFELELKVRTHGEDVLQECRGVPLGLLVENKAEEFYHVMEQSKTTVEEVRASLNRVEVN